MPLARIVRDRDADRVETVMGIVTKALSPIIEILLDEEYIRREWYDDDDVVVAVRAVGPNSPDCSFGCASCMGPISPRST
jgi:hypothetical protein